MPHVCQIYVLFDSDGQVNYVGRTKRPITLRMHEHKRVLGFSPVFRVIDRCSSNCAEVEKRWIGYYRDRGIPLRNINYGQGPHFLSAESRKKLSLAFKGRPNTWGDKISAAQKGMQRNWSAAGRLRVKSSQIKPGESLWGKLSPEQQEINRQIARDMWKDPERRSRMLTGLKAPQEWTPEQRSRAGAKHSETVKSRYSDQERSAMARKGAMGLLAKDPGAMSRRVMKFWADLKADPVRYREYIDRRAKTIAAAKAAKKSK